jgi:GT2 family glycosyltransferase
MGIVGETGDTSPSGKSSVVCTQSEFSCRTPIVSDHIPVSERPTVSVVIPTYNYANYVGTAIDSVLAQTYAPLEIIVVDDGSTDDTASRLAAYGDRIRVDHRKNCGCAASRNAGLRQARGEYVAFLDADDSWDPEKLERQIRAAIAHPDAVLIGCGFRLTDSQFRTLHSLPGKPVHLPSASAVRALMRFDVHIGGASAVMARTSILQSEQGFNEGLVYSEDWEAWMRVASHGTVHILEDVLCSVRQHHQGTFRSATRLREGMMKATDLAIVRHGAGWLERRRAYANVWRHTGFEFEIAKDPEGARAAFRTAARFWPFDWRLVYKALRRTVPISGAVYGGDAA